MDWFVRSFLKASLVWFSSAVLLAVAMALEPALLRYRTAHLHMALLGFVTQMMHGVALHVIRASSGSLSSIDVSPRCSSLRRKSGSPHWHWASCCAPTRLPLRRHCSPSAG